MPHTPQALLFPPAQRAAAPSARAAEEDKFDRAAAAIRPMWPTASKRAVAHASAERSGSAAQRVHGVPSPFGGLPRLGAQSTAADGGSPFDVGLEGDPFRPAQRSKARWVALLVLLLAVVAWVWARSDTQSRPATVGSNVMSLPAPSSQAAPSSPTAPAAAISAPSAEAAAAPALNDSAAAPAASDTKGLGNNAAAAAPATSAAGSGAAAKAQTSVARPAKRAALSPAPGKRRASAPLSTTKAVQRAKRPAPLAKPTPALVERAATKPIESARPEPRRHQAAPIQANPYE